jgi:hypothetical protein
VTTRKPRVSGATVGRAAAREAPLEVGVSSEPVSAPLFPANRVNYRELQRLAPDQAFDLLEKANFINALKEHFPGQVNREGPAPYQGIEIEVRSRIRETSGLRAGLPMDRGGGSA